METKGHLFGAYRDARVLVTGGSGAIGSNLCRVLGRLGAAVTVLDDFSSSHPDGLAGISRCVVREGSVVDGGALERAFAAQPQVVFHLAALFANQKSIEQPERDLLVNGLGTLKVLQYARDAKVARVVYASSSSLVASSASQTPIDEDSASLNLHTPYQVTKLLGELYCNLFRNLYGCDLVRVRFFNSYGPGEMPGRYRNVIPNFIYAALQGAPLRITGSGDETRDWTYVDDIIDGLLRAGVVEEAAGDVFNVASGKETRVADLARYINEITHNGAGIVHGERRGWDHHDRRWASIDKAKRVLGYEPQIDLRTGLERTVAWFRERWPQIRARAQF